MKKVEKISEGINYSSVNVGKYGDLADYTLVIAPGVEIPGKVFVAEELRSTGAEVSFTTMPAGSGVDFLHTHKNNEELYIILKGNGEYQVDGNIFPVSEGSVVRVSPEGKRSYRNTGDDPLVMICIQSKNNSLDGLSVSDGELLNEAVVWS